MIRDKLLLLTLGPVKSSFCALVEHVTIRDLKRAAKLIVFRASMSSHLEPLNWTGTVVEHF